MYVNNSLKEYRNHIFTQKNLNSIWTHSLFRGTILFAKLQNNPIQLKPKIAQTLVSIKPCV